MSATSKWATLPQGVAGSTVKVTGATGAATAPGETLPKLRGEGSSSTIPGVVKTIRAVRPTAVPLPTFRRRGVTVQVSPGSTFASWSPSTSTYGRSTESKTTIGPNDSTETCQAPRP